MEQNFRLGDRVRLLRTQLGLSQEQLAFRAGITPTYLGMVERGKKNATVAVVERISGALGVTLSEFFADEAAPAKSDPVILQLSVLLADCTAVERAALVQIIQQMLAFKAL